MKGKKRASGGGLPEEAGGNPNVFKEAKEKKYGGRVRRATGGKVAAVANANAEPPTKTIGKMHGGGVKARLDRPGRKSGGRVGSNNSPLSSAAPSVKDPPTPKSQVGPAS